MSVTSIRSKTVLGDHYSRRNNNVFEEITYLAGAVLALLAPTVLYCAVIGQFWPLYFMACNEALGTMLGLVMFKKSSNGSLTCIPIHTPNVPSCSSVSDLKKAA